jgi:hypothetical protein
MTNTMAATINKVAQLAQETKIILRFFSLVGVSFLGCFII